jgi:urease accessory protein
MRAELHIELRRGTDGSVRASGDLAMAPYWCRWDGDTLWIVGAAACPVGDDTIAFSLDVGPGVRAAVRGVAATIVYAAAGDGTSITTRLVVREGAQLHWSPEPVIVTERARHRALTEVQVAPGAQARLDEVLVLGRQDERCGSLRSAVRVERDGRAVLRSGFDTALPGWNGPGGTDGARVVGTRVLLSGDAGADPDATSPTPLTTSAPMRADLPPQRFTSVPRSALLRTEHGDHLAVALGDDAHQVGLLLDERAGLVGQATGATSDGRC